METSGTGRDAAASSHLGAMLDALTDASALVDARGIVRYVNATWRRQLQDLGASLDAGPARSDTAIDLVALLSASGAGADELLEPVRAVLAGESERFDQIQPYRAGEQARWRAFAVTPCPAGGARGVLVQQWDVSERLATAEENRRLLEQARAAQRQAEALAEVNAALSVAASEVEILAALARFTELCGAMAQGLNYVELDAQGRPTFCVPVAMWKGGKPNTENSLLNQRIPLTDFPISSLCIANPRDVLLIEDIDTDARVDDLTRHMFRLSEVRAVVLLPLYSGKVWQGILTIVWDAPHRFSEDEARVYASLLKTLAPTVASRRAYLAMQAAHRRAETLATINARLSGAADEQDIVDAVAKYVDRLPGITVSLSYLEVDESGRPVRSRHAALRRGGEKHSSKIKNSTVFTLGDLPTTQHWVNAPDVPLMVGDLRSDPRCDDEKFRAMMASYSVVAIVLIPLYSKSTASWQGLITIAWPTAREFNAEETYIYTSLAQTVPAVLASRRTASLQKQLIELLEATPDMVSMTDSDERLMYMNSSGRRMLGVDPSEDLTRYFIRDFYELEPYEYLMREVLPAAERDGVCSTEISIRHLSGERILASMVAVAHRGGDGKIERFSSIIRDITAQRRAEEERLALQNDLIRAQAAALAERSTPLIPISDQIVVMPLIGLVDAARVQQMTEALLHGCAKARARVAIVDITGVPSLDAEAADGLLRAAHAVRLLGAEVVLTGIRAEVAQTLVSLSVDMTGIRTRGTLESGIAYASGLTGGNRAPVKGSREPPRSLR